MKDFTSFSVSEPIADYKPRGADTARIIQVIEICSYIGSGATEDPVRCLTQYFSGEGLFLAQHDSWVDRLTVSNRIRETAGNSMAVT